ncbi:MAG: hypothetical protein A2381_13980 [Bdellovibrionales bacterium RIFOXYB1_FULL_37_110]|nr:MAG: hypothetical protein A2181_06470 [Bdellovibrionales bacterium RIFOXYA1_FULL_38_20]OFZ52156.1 MAG: hypothetical protein A2417_13165 [Bdellovibrionales bacterium RIFOXYC1_FULL_37_79]OFZ58704.1 MAG: hypothetical protein A2381_13980 [Bdellovibrionales bacterium RIFOXYB1_FULL_37_110]OFZ63490.1 MAG: hypothetical protein A2577_06385 [Bdellovibrionales bacterium RIFOXYD1_FULL_36_51]
MNCKLLLSLTVLLAVKTYAFETIKFKTVGPLFGESKQLQTECTFENYSKTCIIDTGARQSAVGEDSFFLQYPVASQGEMTGFNGEVIITDEILINNFKIGELVLSNLLVDRVGVGFASKNPIIGNDVYWNLTMTFDFNQNVIYLGDQSPDDVKHAGLDTYHEKWIGIPVQIEGDKVKSLWDTGASLSAVDIRYIEENLANFKFVREIEAEDGVGNIVKTKVYKTRLNISGISIQDVTVVAIDFKKIQNDVDPDIKVIVGYNIYSKFNWLIDYKNKKWAVWQK